MGFRAEPPASLAETLLSDAGIRKGFHVHVGCGEGRLLADLGKGGSSLLHGLAEESTAVEKARVLLESRDLYGRVAIDRVASYERLPYASDTANLVVVDRLGELLKKGLALPEVVRILCPKGIGYLGPIEARLEPERLKSALSTSGIKEVRLLQLDERWLRFVKPWPEGIAEWNQFGANATRSSMSLDKVAGPPVNLRWVTGPQWVRWDPGLAVWAFTGNGRYFTGMQPKGSLKDITNRVRAKNGRIQARDAFNGTFLWEKKVTTLPDPRNVVVAGDLLYTVLESGAPVVALDGATGKLRFRLDEPGRSLTYADGMLLAGSVRTAYDAATGRKLWTADERLRGSGPCTVVDGKIYLASRRGLVCGDLKTGAFHWKAPNPGDGRIVTVAEGILLTRRFLRKVAFSAEDGRLLWEYKHEQPAHGGDSRPFIREGRVWIHIGPKGREAIVALDARTGEEKERFPYGGKVKPRCYANRASVNFLMVGGMDFFHFEEKRHFVFHGSRGACGVGYMPANGLVYQPQSYCSCFRQIYSSCAYAPGKFPDLETLAARSSERLEKGPAYLKTGAEAAPTDWPVYRKNPERWGATRAPVGEGLKPLWKTRLGGRVSSPVVAGGRVFVAETDRHRVSAIDAGSGRKLWSHTTGGPVGSAPTYYRGQLFFGGRDGRVTCLSAETGELAWRFRAAPEDRRIVAYGHVESTWPVHGSVIIDKGKLYFLAGRHSEVDGGMILYAAEPATGKILWKKILIRNKGASKVLGPNVDRSDILNMASRLLTLYEGKICVGNYVYDPDTREEAWYHHRGPGMWGGEADFTTDTAQPPYSWKWDRKLWTFGRAHKGGLNSDTSGQVLSAIPAGRTDRGPTFHVYGVRNHPPRVFLGRVNYKGRFEEIWSVPVAGGATMKAAVYAGGRLYVAEQPDLEDPSRGVVRIYSAEDGKERGELELESAPGFDRMAATEGRLFVVTQDGTVICLKGE